VSDALLTVVVFPTGFFAFVLAAFAWNRRETSGAARALSVLLLSLGIWDIGYGLRTANVPAPNPHVWMSLMYVGVATAPTALFVFAIYFAHRERWLTRAVQVALLIEPAAIILAAWTDARLGLLFNDKVGIDEYLRSNAGPAFWVNIVYSYVLMVFATMLLVGHRWSHRHSVYRQQATSVIIGAVLPWIASLLLALNVTSRDLTPLAISLSAFAFGYGILRFRMLEVVPIARDLLIERMSDGVLVVDEHGTVSDINPTGRVLLGMGDIDPVGKHYSDCLQHQPALTALLRSNVNGRIEVEQTRGVVRFLDISLILLEDHRRNRIGALVLARDVSDRKHLEGELERLAGVDPLTAIGNRRMFAEIAERELKRRNRTGQPLSLALIDLDFLKQINDNSGHEAGDLALQRVAEVMQRSSRTSDVPARIGGDEFALLLPDTGAIAAVEALERIRRALRDRTAGDDRFSRLSLSIGIATIAPGIDSFDELMRAADAALYTAKDSGRDRICLASQQ
jgi:diguanylate cyclase (GGDEF)-like protein/PAS domain S-box-containing protein